MVFGDDTRRNKLPDITTYRGDSPGPAWGSIAVVRLTDGWWEGDFANFQTASVGSRRERRVQQSAFVRLWSPGNTICRLIGVLLVRAGPGTDETTLGTHTGRQPHAPRAMLLIHYLKPSTTYRLDR